MTDTITENAVETESHKVSRAPKQLTPWKKGESGNPLGKKPGTRDRVTLVSNAILSAINNKHKSLVAFIEQQLEENPLEVLKLLVKLQPKQTQVSGQVQQIVFNVAPIGQLPPRRIAAVESISQAENAPVLDVLDAT